MASCTALITDNHGRILVVDPTYKDGFDMPGGMVHADETQVEGLVRELAEELDLTGRVHAYTAGTGVDRGRSAAGDAPRLDPYFAGKPFRSLASGDVWVPGRGGRVDGVARLG
nr:NUDIX hydrolase [Streptomyces sp. NBC_00857]